MKLKKIIFVFVFSTFIFSSISHAMIQTSAPVRSGDLVDKIKDESGFTPEMSDSSPLIIAAEEGKSAIVAKLIALGVELKDSWEAENALGWASYERHSDIVKMLLEGGVSANSTWSLGTPLRAAVHKRCYTSLELLLSHNAQVNTDIKNDSPLYLAALYGYRTIFDTLLARGADVNKPGDLGNTPLHHAKSAYMVQRLLSSGAKIDSRNCNNETPLITLVQCRPLEAVTLVLDAGAEVNAFDYRGIEALHKAAENFNAEKTKLLLERKADPIAKDQWGNMPIDYVVNRACGISDIDYLKREAPRIIETIDLLFLVSVQSLSFQDRSEISNFETYLKKLSTSP